MTANQLKIIAIIGMTMNHTVYAFREFLPLWLMLVLNAGGGLTFPLMAFFLNEGFQKTSNLRKYFLRIFAFALVSQLPFILALRVQFYVLNILFTLVICLFMLWLCDRYPRLLSPLILVNAILFALPVPVFFDWGFIGILIVLLYKLPLKESLRHILPGLVAGAAIFYTNLSRVLNANNPSDFAVGLLTFSIGSVVAAFLLLLYKGKRGKGSKYLFYVYYPGHLMLLFFIREIINYFR